MELNIDPQCITTGFLVHNTVSSTDYNYNDHYSLHQFKIWPVSIR